jgi:LAO/AO transport system kinase
MPESGDAIQTLKAGIMEIADIYLVNKADQKGSNQMAAAIRSMLRLASTHRPWDTPVLTAQARSNVGIDELWAKVQEHRKFLESSSELAERRTRRRKQEFLETVEEELGRRLKAFVEADPALIITLDKVVAGEADPYESAINFLGSLCGSDGLLGPLSSQAD